MPEIQDQVQIFESPQLPITKVEDDPWLRDEQAFFLKLPELLKTLRGKWGAVYNEEVVEIGDTHREVRLRFCEKFPNAEVYIQLVDEKLPVAKMLSPTQQLRPAVERHRRQA
ncbi:hypothetical protein L0244_37515 [bacterium]|nr:hypothetical protein [bacterium]